MPLQRLTLHKLDRRSAVKDATSAKALYEGVLADDY